MINSFYVKQAINVPDMTYKISNKLFITILVRENPYRINILVRNM
jgi:hypothetical protein